MNTLSCNIPFLKISVHSSLIVLISIISYNFTNSLLGSFLIVGSTLFCIINSLNFYKKVIYQSMFVSTCISCCIFLLLMAFTFGKPIDYFIIYFSFAIGIYSGLYTYFR